MASTSDDLGYLICVLPNFSTSIVEEIFDNNSAFEDWVKENPSHYANFIPTTPTSPFPRHQIQVWLELPPTHTLP
ncbi:hypothetical protein G6F37_012082 [Rhizopus arrhizus]|nr:hypothetical protein G6F38_012117 [Rhizopus arrhizus]KAG1145796.1 hypothetical protein G6F37_012082 [Rhizopus arrhizus]